MFKKFLLFLLIAVGVFSLAACNRDDDPDDGELSVEDKLEEAAGRILFVDTGAVTGNLTFPTSLVHGVTVSWASDNTAVISNTGAVTRPEAGEGNATVTVTATLSLEGEDISRDFTFTVLEKPESNAYTDFATLIDEAEKGDIVEVQGVVVATFNGGYFISDGTNILGVYYFDGVATLGDEVYLTGEYNNYYTLWQITGTVEEEVLSSGNDYTVTHTEITLADLIALDSDADRLIAGSAYRVTGQVEICGQYDNVCLVDGDASIMVYYQSPEDSITALEAMEGKFITIDVFYYTDHAADGVLVLFQGSASDITEVELGDEEAFDADTSAVSASADFTIDESVTLPATGANGTAFTGWTSSNPDVLANDGAFVGAPATTTVVTFTATATLGTLTETVTVEVEVLALMTIGEAIARTDQPVYFEGIVYQNVQANQGFFVYDGTDYIYIRDTSFVSRDGDMPFAEGTVVRISGVRTDYRGIPQVTAIDVAEAVTSDAYTLPVSEGVGTVAEIIAGDFPAGSIVTVTGIVEIIVGNFTDYRITSDDLFLQVHHNSNNSAFADFDGQLVTVDVIVFQWDYSTPYVAFFGAAEDITVGELSDQQKANLAANNLDLGDLSGVFDDLTLPVTGDYDSTVEWASDNEAVIATDGTVTRTATEETVTLTATVTVGTATATATFTVTVLDETYVPTGITVSAALASEVGTTLYVEGVVSSYASFTGKIFIQDTDGTGIYIDASLADDVAIGDKIVVKGVLENYTGFGNDFLQLDSSTTVLSNDEGGHAVTVITDATWAEILSDFDTFSNVGVRYRMENVVIDGFGFWSFLTTTGVDGDMNLRFNSGSYGGHLEDLYAEGDIIPFVEFTVYDLYSGSIRVEAVTFPELTNADVQTIADSRLALPETTTQDLDLPATLEIEGVNYDLAPDVYDVVWTSNNTAVITDAGVVTQPAIGEADATVVMTATITFEDTTTYAVDTTVTVPAEEEPVVISWDYVEDFSFLTSSTTSYSTSVQHTDTNGFTWDLLGRQNVGSWMLGNQADGSYIEITATGGIGSISFDMVRAFTNTNVRSAELFVNDVSVGTFTVDPESTDVQTFLLENINVEGPVVIKLVSTSPGSRGAFNVENISWTGYEAPAE